MSDDEVPASTFGDYSGTNDLAGEVPSNYEICDRSGFRVEPGQLRKQWDGLMVRSRDFDYRHPQELLRGRPEQPRSSRSPEAEDEFLGLADVSASDL